LKKFFCLRAFSSRMADRAELAECFATLAKTYAQLATKLNGGVISDFMLPISTESHDGRKRARRLKSDEWSIEDIEAFDRAVVKYRGSVDEIHKYALPRITKWDIKAQLKLYWKAGRFLEYRPSVDETASVTYEDDRASEVHEDDREADDTRSNETADNRVLENGGDESSTETPPPPKKLKHDAKSSKPAVKPQPTSPSAKSEKLKTPQSGKHGTAAASSSSSSTHGPFKPPGVTAKAPTQMAPKGFARSQPSQSSSSASSPPSSPAVKKAKSLDSEEREHRHHKKDKEKHKEKHKEKKLSTGADASPPKKNPSKESTPKHKK